MARGIVCTVLFFYLAVGNACAQEKITSQSCLDCHTDNDPQKNLSSSVHDGLDCVDCHTDIKELPHQDNLKKADCSSCHDKETKAYLSNVHGLAFLKGNLKAAACSDCHGTHDINKANKKDSKLYWLNIPGTCGQCHKKEIADYTLSIHGQALAQGNRDTPVCTDCHGEHSIEAAQMASSRVSSAHIPETCGQCHTAERINAKYSLSSNVLGSYMQSYHGLAIQQGSVVAASCASCHGAHDILPSSDKRSSIYPKNLENTCGQCHPGIGAQVAQGKIHASKEPQKDNPANELVKNIYIFLIFFISGVLLLHNLLDFSKKARAYYRYTLQQGTLSCMGLHERIQHFILTTTFILLAYTGFALKFPQAWWAMPFFGKNDWLRYGHRGVGIVFCVLTLYHLYYLFLTSKGRRHLSALSIKISDLSQFFETFGFYLGLKKQKPHLPPYSYIQKLEYWALVWGSLIMILTGVLMFNEVWFLNLLPKWFYDVVRTVHAYEAILACVTIVIWHGYFVMFDPDVYPGDFSWLHGKHARKKSEE